MFPNNKNFVVQFPNGNTINEAIKLFMRGYDIDLIDKLHYPDNIGCNGILTDNCAETVGLFCIKCEPGYLLTSTNQC